ncbi:biopolymer transport protein ExbD [Cohaesibacter sp. ES.047]|uniref:ExbD/TolR family protein n=1 Tax=Cohaesibacter sp. ES.047 TaxID=1798205 RepID=UPI000BB83E5D|nr:biopolymer transporter ExbD [Cohaesibacter sp. ES.047]SNY92708.1 biopolymer transport protein ExbD [Cohaesibacter sp. ES.047]
MQMHKAKAHRRVLPENTIPLINIVFLMLIFFLIAGTVAPPISPSLSPPSAVDLPQMPPADNAIEILADGTLVHRGDRLTLADVLSRFPVTGERGEPETDVVKIVADKALPADKLMPVLKALRGVGHRSIRLVTLKTDT